MSEPIQFEFFCSEVDYPNFRTLFPDHFPPTYGESARNRRSRPWNMNRSRDAISVS